MSAAQRDRVESEPLYVTIRDHGILAPDQLAESAKQFAEAEAPAEVLSWLIDQAWITAWQAEQIQAGKHGEFSLGDFRLTNLIREEDPWTYYEGRDSKGSPVLIKVLPKNQSAESDLLSRLRRESRIGSFLEHPSFSRTIQLGETEKFHYLATEGLSGARFMDSWLEYPEPLPIDWICECMRQAALGAQCMHDEDVLHRALSLKTLLIQCGDDQETAVKVVGLGFIHSEKNELKGTTITLAEDLVGDIDSMAPELADGPLFAEPKSDLYSLGCMLFHLLTGETPFDGASPMERLHARLREDPPKVQWIRKDVTADLSLLVEQLLSRDPLERPESAAEVAERMAAFAVPLAHPGGKLAPVEQQISPRMEELLGQLESTKLFSAAQLDSLKRLAKKESDPDVFVEGMVEHGYLSTWQAKQVHEGRTDFFYGSYQIMDDLDDLGAGAVYKAENQNGRKVALKVFAKEFQLDLDALGALQGSDALPRHPNVVSFLEAGRADSGDYVVLEYVRGYDLQNWIGQIGRLPIEWSCECIQQAARGLEHARERGLLHLSLRPRSLLVEERGFNHAPVVKVLGLGLTQAVKNASGTVSSIVPAYVSPEQAEGRDEIDARADLYGLGCALYEMLTGRLPFQGEDPQAQMDARLHEDPPPPSEFCPEISPELEAVLLKMLARDPDDRFASSEELIAALEPWSMDSSADSQSSASEETQQAEDDAEEFYSLLRRSSLFSPEHVTQIRRQMPESLDAKAIADRLVEGAQLTVWQSRELLGGRSDFHMGAYKLLDGLSKNSTTTMYKAEDRMGRLVAVRVLDVPDEKPEQVLHRFRKEGRMAAALDHKHLVRVFDAGEDDGRAFLVMEYVAGRTLKTWLNERKNLPIEWSCRCIRQAALGLQHAHEHDVVHRNVQPSNVSVGEGDLNSPPKVKILETGFFPSLDEDESSSSLDQLPLDIDYIAPELAEHPRADVRADV
ncbi:MAG: serine/threonine protein kinase [Planctomycetales bacterium]